MSLIKCPQCGKEISEYAAECVHCGYKLKKSEQPHCPECGKELSGDETICPNCGFPLDEVSSDQSAPKKKTPVWTFVFLAVILAALAAGIFAASQSSKKQVYAETVMQMTEAHDDSFNAVNDCSRLLMAVWKNAICQTADPETDRFTRPDGRFVEDFNEALDNLYQDENFSSQLELINKSQQKLRALKKKLPKPPVTYEDINECLIKAFDNWIEISMTILNPTGSYNDAEHKFNELFSEAAELYNELQSYADAQQLS